MYFDLDWSFTVTGDSPLSGILSDGNGERALMLAVLKSAEGKDAFLKRYAYLMSTVLNEQYINGVIDTLAASNQSEVPRDRERWGLSVASWNSAVQRVRNYVKDGVRTTAVKANLKSYFSLTDEQMAAYFGA